MNRNQVVAILSLIVGISVVLCVCGFGLFAFFQVQHWDDVFSSFREVSPILAPSTPTRTQAILLRPSPLPPPTSTPTMPIATVVYPTLVFPTQPIAPFVTAQASKCDQPSIKTAMQQAYNRATSLRIQLKGSDDKTGSTANLLYEEVVESAGMSIHRLMIVNNPQGASGGQEIIAIRNLMWERQLDGTWGHSKVLTATLDVIGLNMPPRAANLSDLPIQGKVGTMLYANQPTDIYWLKYNNNRQGTLYVNPKTCLPILILSSDDSTKEKNTATFEWNIPLKITPPGP